ncbi:MAG: S8 family serine peptidase [Verrucomicrobiales bacterium]|nr:S8 family serine peptidase [Verrucomicrobiales bacterium]
MPTRFAVVTPIAVAPAAATERRLRSPLARRPSAFAPILVATCLLAALLTASAAPAAPAEGTLHWHRAERRVDADLQSWPLSRTLERIAEATGWLVLVEPGLESPVSAKFDRRPEREALASLLADVNFALVPSPSGPARLLVFRSSTAQATQIIRPPLAEKAASTGTNVIANELVVRLKPGTGASLQELAKRLGARVVGSIDSLDAYRLQFDSAEAAAAAREALTREENVASVESNYTLGTPGSVLPAPGATAPPLSGLRARPMNDASSVIIALLDTGLATSGLAHADFLLPSVPVASAASASAQDSGLSHGSAMFETILQGLSVTQQESGPVPVRVLPVDIYGASGQTTTFELAQGIAAALERGADILNLSLSGPSPSPVVHDILKQASAAGVITFGAPGNTPSTLPTYPAAYPEVLAVTASDRPGQIATYANRGVFVDLIAPGTSVVPFQGDSFVVHGTSVSTAYAAGLAGGLLANGTQSPAEAVRTLQQKLAFQPPAPAPSPKP